MSSSSFFLSRHRNAAALAASVASTGFYVAFRSHDQRALSENEVAHARGTLARITPPLFSASASSTTSTANTNTATAKSQHGSVVAQEHFDNINRCGATVVRDTLSPSQLMEWNAKIKEAFDRGQDIVWQSGRAYHNITHRSVHRSEMSCIGSRCSGDADDTNAGDDKYDTINEKTHSSWLTDFWFRRRSSSNNKNSAENTTTTVPKSVYLQDVVQSYFKHHGIKRYGLTDIQFLNAFPKSTNQIWHSDNIFPGLTAIVALKDVRSNGPTEVILGSHQQSFSLWQMCLKAMQSQSHLPLYFKQDGGVVKNSDDDSIPEGSLIGCIDAGDTFLYDARLFHRGRGNYGSSEGEGNIGDRPVLVLRWDAAHTPPPGAGIIVTTANEYFGSMIYALLFTLQKRSTTTGNKNDK